MPRIVFVHSDGTTVDVHADLGNSMMQVATANNIDGIIGECGGNLLCATCHVYIEQGPIERLPPVSSFEEELLDCTATEREQTSRLSCQIPVSEALEGLVVSIPERQV